jgi:outer membrane protein
MNRYFCHFALWVFTLGSAFDAMGQSGPIRALSPTEQPVDISLKEAISKTLEQNEDLKIIHEALQQQKIAAFETWSYLLPKWSINGQYQFNDREQSMSFQSRDQLDNQALLYESIATMMEQSAAAIPDPNTQEELQGQAGDLRDVAGEFRDTDIEPTIITPREVFTADTTVRQPLFNGRALPVMRNAYTMVDMAQLNQEQIRQSLAQATIQSYYVAWLGQENLGSSRRQLTRSKEHVAATQRRVDAGLLPISNLHRARLEEIKANQTVQQVQNGMSQSKGALGFIMGEEKDFNLVAPQFVAETQIDELSVLLDRALSQRPDLKSQKLSLLLSQRMRNEAWFRYLPTVNLVAQTRYTNNTSGFVSDPFISMIAVQGAFTIFDGGQRIAALRTSASKIRTERTKLEKLRRDVKSQIRGLISDIETKKLLLSQTKEAKVMAEKTRDNVVHTQMSGLATQLEVLDANHALFLSELQETQAHLGLDLAYWELYHAQGSLISLLEETQPPQ